MRKTILYTGVGSTKSGKLTNAEFLNVMEKEFITRCPNYFTKKTNKNCIRETKMIKQMANKNVFNMNTKKYKNTSKKCANKLIKKRFKCNTNQYIEFSGAERLK